MLTFRTDSHKERVEVATVGVATEMEAKMVATAAAQVAAAEASGGCRPTTTSHGSQHLWEGGRIKYLGCCARALHTIVTRSTVQYSTRRANSAALSIVLYNNSPVKTRKYLRKGNCGNMGERTLLQYGMEGCGRMLSASPLAVGVSSSISLCLSAR